MITTELIINLLLILTVAWIVGSIFARFGLPAMLGELLAGILLGPPVLGLVEPSASLELMAEMGIFFVMFYGGMEMDARELMEHLKPSFAVGIGGFLLAFALGIGLTLLFGGTLYQSLFVGIGMSASAIAVQSVILNSLRINKTYIGHIIIGGAIVDNILALSVLSFLLGIAETGEFDVWKTMFIILKVIVFFGLTLVLGYFVMPKITRNLHDREGKGFTFALGTALIMAYLAQLAGLHLVIGAFLAGQLVRKEIMDEKIYHAIADRFYGISYGFLVPIFFVSLSFHLHFDLNLSFFLFTLALIVAALLGKFAGCGLGAFSIRRNIWDSIVVGFGMNGRGAVEMVIATVVIAKSDKLIEAGVITTPLLTDNQFSALILMAFVTTILAPILMKWSALKACRSDEKASFCTIWEQHIGD